ncbi:MAG: ATP synthase F1 subunit delta [Candidatus Zixiibacteriota bacterium]|nr:MAG: ATP synthase F1 subunit delta [candidate division Zixibacteria bacterium]
MIESRVAVKYATALFRTAKRIAQLESISRDLVALSELLSKNVLLRNFVESPQVLEKDKKELLTSTFKPMISEALFSFLMLLLSKHRIQYLVSMTEEFQRLVKEDQGIVEARLITARSLDQALSDQLREELEKSTGKKVEMKLEQDPSLIGGIVVILGDKIIDRSIRYQLSQLKDQMSALKVY